MPEHQKNKTLTEKQLGNKMETMAGTYTPAERLEDRLVAIKGFLVAMKLGHPLPMSLDEAIEMTGM